MPAASYGSTEPSVSITCARTSSRLSERLIFFVISSSRRSFSVRLNPDAGAVMSAVSSAISERLYQRMKMEEGWGNGETGRRTRYLSPRLPVSSSLRRYIILHPFDRLFRQQLKLQRGRGVLPEEVVDIGREIDDGEARAARGEHLLVARGGAASGCVGVERGDYAGATERREPLLFQPARADEAHRVEAVREERERVREALDEVDDPAARERPERVNIVERGDVSAHVVPARLDACGCGARL